jgi:catechol 2,3-dioxygenase-like lactoylglutathione lyase family enzyme
LRGVRRSIRHVAFLVRDQDEALAFFVDTLGFVVAEDTRLGDKRWLTVAPEAGGSPSLLLSVAATPEQHRAVGRQAGGRAFLFLETDDLERDHRRLKQPASAAGDAERRS